MAPIFSQNMEPENRSDEREISRFQLRLFMGNGGCSLEPLALIPATNIEIADAFRRRIEHNLERMRIAEKQPRKALASEGAHGQKSEKKPSSARPESPNPSHIFHTDSIQILPRFGCLTFEKTIPQNAPSLKRDVLIGRSRIEHF